MANIGKLIVFQEARELLRAVQQLTEGIEFGDLRSQIRRAAISVVSNICEGAGSASDKQFARYCRMAKGSVNEVFGQLHILSDLGLIAQDHSAIALSDRISRRLYCLIKRLESG